MKKPWRIEIPHSGFRDSGHARARNGNSQVRIYRCPRCQKRIETRGMPEGEAGRVKRRYGKALCESCRIIFTPIWSLA